MSLQFRLYALILFALCLPLAGRAYAQPVPNSIPARQDPARIEERLEDRERSLRRQPSRGMPGLETPAPPSLRPDTDRLPAGPRFSVSRLSFTGQTVLNESELRSATQAAIGPDVTLARLEAAAQGVTELYIQRGYPFARAYVPPQTIESGVAEIRIAEGHVADVEIRGANAADHALLRAYSDALMERRPVSQTWLERYLLLMNDLPGISARAILAPGDPDTDAPGAVRIAVLVDKSNATYSLALDNRGSESIGPHQVTGSFDLNNLTGYNERTSISAFVTPDAEEIRYFALSQDWILGASGTRLSASVRRSDSEPGGQSALFELEGQSNTAEIALSHPFIRSRRENLHGGISFSVRNSKTESFDTEIINDHLRMLSLDLNYDRAHHKGISRIGIGVDQGLDIMNATADDDPARSRTDGESDAGLLRAEAERLQRLTERTSLLFEAEGQWAWKPVLSPALYGVGGARFGRAWDYSEIVGDSGYGASVQLIRNVPPETLGKDFRILDTFELYAFVDGGQTFSPGNPDDYRWESLMSTGIGANVALDGGAFFQWEIAKPLVNDARSRDNNVSSFFTIGVRNGL